MHLKNKTMAEKNSDIRLYISKQLLRQEELFYVHTIEQLPQVPKSEVRYQGQLLNLSTLTCTCNESLQRRELFGEGRDMRILCKHLYLRIKRFLPVDSLTAVLAEHQHKHGVEILLHRKVRERDVYFGFSSAKNPPDWVSVYLTNDPDRKIFVRFSYSINERRWAYSIPPADAEAIESYLLLLFLKSSRFKRGFSVTF